MFHSDHYDLEVDLLTILNEIELECICRTTAKEKIVMQQAYPRANFEPAAFEKIKAAGSFGLSVSSTQKRPSCTNSVFIGTPVPINLFSVLNSTINPLQSQGIRGIISSQDLM